MSPVAAPTPPPAPGAPRGGPACGAQARLAQGNRFLNLPEPWSLPAEGVGRAGPLPSLPSLSPQASSGHRSPLHPSSTSSSPLWPLCLQGRPPAMPPPSLPEAPPAPACPTQPTLGLHPPLPPASVPLPPRGHWRGRGSAASGQAGLWLLTWAGPRGVLPASSPRRNSRAPHDGRGSPCFWLRFHSGLQRSHQRKNSLSSPGEFSFFLLQEQNILPQKNQKTLKDCVKAPTRHRNRTTQLKDGQRVCIDVSPWRRLRDCQAREEALGAVGPWEAQVRLAGTSPSVSKDVGGRTPWRGWHEMETAWQLLAWSGGPSRRVPRGTETRTQAYTGAHHARLAVAGGTG